LTATLDSLGGLLRSSGWTFWAEWIESSRDRIQRGDGYGLDYLLSAYGGMGSLNDLDLASETDQLRALKSEAWSLATELRAELLRR
jgi:hypothetical protein